MNCIASYVYIDISFFCSLSEAIKDWCSVLLEYSKESRELFVQTTFAALVSVYCLPTWRGYVIGQVPSKVNGTRNKTKLLENKTRHLRKSLPSRAVLVRSELGEIVRICFSTKCHKSDDICSPQEGTWNEYAVFVSNFVKNTLRDYEENLKEITKNCQVWCKWALFVLIVLMTFGIAVYMGPLVFFFLIPLLIAKKKTKKLHSEILYKLDICDSLLEDLEIESSNYMRQRCGDALRSIEAQKGSTK